jgi:hypothetical protein
MFNLIKKKLNKNLEFCLTLYRFVLNKTSNAYDSSRIQLSARKGI